MYSNSMKPAEKTIGSVQAATEVLGDKWTPALLRCLLSEDSVRFCQLQALAGGINPRTLSARLSSLEQTGIIEKVDPHKTRCEYRITQKGRDLLPILRGMEQWSKQYASADVQPNIVG